MKRHAAPLLWLLTALALVRLYIDAVWSHYSDIAHHYALIARLSEMWQLPLGLDPTLGEMNYYPPLSHRLAVLAGRLAHSNFLGLQLVALSALAGVWAAFIWMLTTLPRRAATTTAAAALALLVLNQRYWGIALHGDEIIGNYFYAQLVAQALAAGVLAWCLWLEQRGTLPWRRYVYLLCAAAVVAWAHLLPAIELLGLLLALLAFEWLMQPQPQRSAREFGSRAAFAAFAAGFVYIHPSFYRMQLIGMNDGALSFRHLPDLSHVALLAGGVLAASLLVLWRWIALDAAARRAYLLLKYLALFGASVAGLTLLQYALLRAGVTTPYAVKKYVFALDTLALLYLALLPAMLWRRLRDGDSDRARLLLGPALLIVAVTAVAHAKPSHSVRALAQLEREMLTLRDTALAKAPGDHFAVALAGMPPGFNYLYSIGVLRAPRKGNALDLYEARPFSEPEKIGVIVTSPGVQPYDKRACRRGATPQLVAIDAACAANAAAHALDCKPEHDFAPEGDLDERLLQGFSGAEPHGRWTAAPQAEFVCSLPAGFAPRTAVITAAGFVPKAHAQKVLVAANGGPDMVFHFDAAMEKQQLTVPLPAGDGKHLRLRFTLSDAVSPQQMQLGGDTRTLGIAVRRIELR
ncbi:MAG TPA: hypothetical protein VIT92_08345 [Burkholderiaceae bacterium]